jgi:hypothetical protein
MNFKHLLFALLLVLAGKHCLAQEDAYNKSPEFLKANSFWAFGVGAGLDFNSGTAVPISTRQLSDAGCASVSDPVTGKLLFYTNGNKVWDAHDFLMPNGSGLLGNALDSTQLATPQGVCIVPVINKPGQYYLFSLSGPSSGGPKPEGTLFYNIIDMSLNGGMGDVVPGQKNIALDTTMLSPAMIAVPGNNCDVWLMVHHGMFEHEYKAYHITAQGIDALPVISNTGAGGFLYVRASMVVSPDRTRICLVGGAPLTWFLLDQFDATTGKVKHDMMLDASPTLAYPQLWQVTAAAFSPDNSKLYIHIYNTVDTNTQFVDPSWQIAGIYQYDLSHYDSTAIDTSKKYIGAPVLFGNVTGSMAGGARIGWGSLLRLYNDTLYMGMYENIHRINKPNLLGAACDLQLKAIKLSPGDTCSGNFGAEVVYPMVEVAIGAAAQEVFACRKNPSATLQAPKGYSAYVWEDGSIGEARSVNQLGKYWVRSKDVNDFCNQKVDTFIVLPWDYPVPEITIYERTLGTTEPYDTYQWMLEDELIVGAQASSLKVDKNGNYRVIVSFKGCIDTSDVYKVTNADGGSGMDDLDLLSTSLRIYPNPATNSLSIYPNIKANIRVTSIDGKVMLKQEQVNRVSVQELAEGIYFLQVFDDTDRLLKVMKFTVLR